MLKNYKLNFCLQLCYQSIGLFTNELYYESFKESLPCLITKIDLPFREFIGFPIKKRSKFKEIINKK